MDARKILPGIDSPEDIRKLTVEELGRLASEIRQVILETVSRNGGHLAPSLGTVELTLAIHYVFDTPRDRLIWDVGHQAYAHKIITQTGPVSYPSSHGRDKWVSQERRESLRRIQRRAFEHVHLRRRGHWRKDGVLTGEDFKVIAVSRRRVR